jgi:hypothetical protein
MAGEETQKKKFFRTREMEINQNLKNIRRKKVPVHFFVTLHYSKLYRNKTAKLCQLIINFKK